MTKFIRRRTALAVGFAAGALAAPMLARHSQAQDIYPSGMTERVVVPFAAGGTTDLLARVVAQIIVESTASSFAIDNRTGAGGNVSAEAMAGPPHDVAAWHARHGRHQTVSL